ncbi:unnamed protein product [Linum tenue]|uniref:DUF1308 domain-containing protein n=1 Tax=Linum tenue TaxID=586396 RepID=A0AAV0IR77_9ROSI|nr:unnamed protein product [Linum tenue]
MFRVRASRKENSDGIHYWELRGQDQMTKTTAAAAELQMEEEIREASERCKRVIERVARLPASTNITDSCRRTLLKLANSELNFLSRSSASLATSPNPPLSVNIGHLEAVVYILEQPFVTGVSRVCKRVSLLPIGIKNGNHEDETDCGSSLSSSVHVDIVCTLNKRPVWIVVSDRNPMYVYWHGYRKGKGLKLRIEQVIAAARSTEMMRPLSIILFFPRGVGDSVRQNLEDEFGASKFDFQLSGFDSHFSEEVVDGGWINVVTRSYREASVFEIKLDNDAVGVPRSGSGISAPTVSDHQDGSLKLNSDDLFCSIVSGMRTWPPEIRGKDLSAPGVLQGIDELLNFGTTALVAIVSGISNGCAEKLLAAPEFQLQQQFKGNTEFVIGQVKALFPSVYLIFVYLDFQHTGVLVVGASCMNERKAGEVGMKISTRYLSSMSCQVMSEVENPLLAELVPVVSGKRGIVCSSVLSEFKELVSMFGGANEKLRTHKLLERLLVAPDSPSGRMLSLPTTRKLDLKSKIVFGTGDSWRAPTLTANMGFVRAVSQTGMSLFTIPHRPRALIGD